MCDLQRVIVVGERIVVIQSSLFFFFNLGPKINVFKVLKCSAPF